MGRKLTIPEFETIIRKMSNEWNSGDELAMQSVIHLVKKGTVRLELDDEGYPVVIGNWMEPQNEQSEGGKS